MNTNTHLEQLIVELRTASSKNDAPVWRAVAEKLEKPTRQRVHVNLSKLTRVTKQGEIIIVPGKLLGDGELTHQLTIAAIGASSSATAKLKLTKSTLITITDMMKQDPKGKSVRIIA